MRGSVAELLSPPTMNSPLRRSAALFCGAVCQASATPTSVPVLPIQLNFRSS
jgi:hypothetical protein